MISNIAYDIIEILEIQKGRYDIVGAGGLLLNSDIYWNRICERINSFVPQYTLTRLQIPLVAGMALKTIDNILKSGNVEIKIILENHSINI